MVRERKNKYNLAFHSIIPAVKKDFSNKAFETTTPRPKKS